MQQPDSCCSKEVVDTDGFGPLAWLLVRLARLCDAVEDDGALGLLINLSDADPALWIGAGRTSVETALKEWRSRGRGPPAREAGHHEPAPPAPRTPAWRLAPAQARTVPP